MAVTGISANRLELLQIADTLNLVEGASWDEATTGTSAASVRGPVSTSATTPPAASPTRSLTAPSTRATGTNGRGRLSEAWVTDVAIP